MGGAIFLVDAECCEIPKDLVGRGVGSDPVLVGYEVSVVE